MRKDLQQYIFSDRELLRFLREQPQWHRTLSRNPFAIEQFQIASLHYFKKTVPDHVDRFSGGVQMAGMMLGVFQAMKNSG